MTRTPLRLLVAALVATGTAGIATGCGSGSSGVRTVTVAPTTGTPAASAPTTTPPATTATTATTPSADVALPGTVNGAPPWPANTEQLGLRLKAIGLPALSAPGRAVQLEQHLDVWFDDLKVPIPAKIGIGNHGRLISPLTTHDASGVTHVESPTRRTYTLGQFFGVWGVELDSTGLAGTSVGSGELLRVWVNGKPLAGDPGKLTLAQHQEIAIVYGTKHQLPKKIPATYDFGAAKR